MKREIKCGKLKWLAHCTTTAAAVNKINISAYIKMNVFADKKVFVKSKTV